jgi:pSer/pThr/pTyr-binding forkhead associated (FHA) protein
VETKPSTDRAKLKQAAQMAGRLVVRPSGAQIVLPVGKAELTIGRSDPARGAYPDVDLTGYSGESSGVSRMHARLLVQANGQIYIEDLNSTNFTFLNKQRLQPGQSYPLKRGDEIRLGLLTLEYLDT